MHLPDWNDEARYVYEERIGIGLDLGMTEADARNVAHREAVLVNAGVCDAARALVCAALVHFPGCTVRLE